MLFTLAALLLAPGPGRAALPEADPDGIAFFERKIRPLLAENCFSCHGPDKQKGGLRLDSPGAIRAGGDKGPVLRPGDPDGSRVIVGVRHGDEKFKMPPKQRLSDSQIAILVEWIQRGAPMPAGTEAAAPAPKREFTLTAQDRAHWAFQPLRRPPVPQSPSSAPSAHPIDAFIRAGLAARHMEPNPPASPRGLIRRVTYDLTGLPPSPEEVEAFAADPSPGAWEQLVERLLESPRYGERWGRHWLDLVRFAESNSYERDDAKPHAWRYRDYVIRSFNADKPYDRFLREQLAGDELPDANDETRIATGYYRLGIWDDEPADRELAAYDQLDDIVTTTGQVFLGLTVDCARCHDHKIDPIPQRDYYRLLAFFHNLAPYRNGGPTDEMPLGAASGGGPSQEKALVATELRSNRPPTHVLLRGNPANRGERVEPGFPEVLGGGDFTPVPVAEGCASSGRRSALAAWLTARDNPLTARVMANRIWQHHFGRGLVRSPNNFGKQGDAPTHPQLLDWLASELIAQGWRLKPLHRLILSSQTYRQSARGRPDGLAADPANDLFWRYDPRRLAAEEIRDTLLAVSGSLNLKMFGPGIFVDIPREVLAGQSRPGSGWGHSPPDEQNRRSIYIFAKRSLLTPILESFDLAETDRSTPVRFTTVQPTQALGMLNGVFLNQQAAVFAARVRREAGADPRAQARRMLSLATCRPPTGPELSRVLQLLAALRALPGCGDEAALRQACLMTLNLNEVIYLD